MTAARDDLRELVAPLRAEVARHRAGTAARTRRQPDVFAAEDFVMAARVLRAAEPLPAWRRALVKRSCARIFGRHATELAAESPPADDSVGAIAGPLLISLVRSRRELTPARKFGLLHRALLTDGDSPELRRVERELARLASRW